MLHVIIIVLLIRHDGYFNLIPICMNIQNVVNNLKRVGLYTSIIELQLHNFKGSYSISFQLNYLLVS